MDPCDLFAQDLITHTASRSGAVAGGMGVTLRREKAEALFRIALARLSSRASLASSLLLVASCVVVPTLRPASIRAFLTQVRTTSPMAPSSSSSAILRIAPLTHTGPASASSAIPVARSRSSSGLLHAASYSRDPPAPSTPPNPGRSTHPLTTTPATVCPPRNECQDTSICRVLGAVCPTGRGTRRWPLSRRCRAGAARAWPAPRRSPRRAGRSPHR